MSMTIKMLDETGKGFRLVSVGEPVDIQVISGDTPRIVVHQAIASLSRGYPLVNNAYIMNAAGDTISKIDYKEVKSGQPGMGGLYREALHEGTETVDIPSLIGADPEKIVAAARDIFFAANPHLREQLATAGLTPGGLSEVLKNTQDEELGEDDCGTILAIFPGMSGYGVYLGGEHIDVHALTARQIRRYTVYAKPETITDLRKTGFIPETKLKLLEENAVKVNGESTKSVADRLNQYAGVEELLPAYYNEVFEHLGDGAAEAFAYVQSLLDPGAKQVDLVVQTFKADSDDSPDKTLYVLVGDEFVRSFTYNRSSVTANMFDEHHLEQMKITFAKSKALTPRSDRWYNVSRIDGVTTIKPNRDGSLIWGEEPKEVKFDNLVEVAVQDYAGPSLGLFAPLPEEMQKKAYEEALALVHNHPGNTIRGCIAQTRVLGEDDLSERVILVRDEKLVIGFLKNTSIDYSNTRLTTTQLVQDSESIVWYKLNPGNNPKSLIIELVKPGPVNGMQAFTGSEIG